MYDNQVLLVFHSLTKITGYESGGWWLLYLFSLFVVEIISVVLLGRSAAAAEIRAVLLSVEQDRLGGGVAVTRHASQV